MKVALLDRRFGTSEGVNPDRRNNWSIRHGMPEWYSNYSGNGNTFSFMDAFGEIMTGPSESGTDYTPLIDYDLVYIRARGPAEISSTADLNETCPKPVKIVYTDEWINQRSFDTSSWITEISKNVDAVTCGFGEPYEKEAFAQLGIDNYYHCPYGGDIHSWSKWYKPMEEREHAVAGMWHMRSFKEQGRGTKIHRRTLDTLRTLQHKFGVKCYFFLNFDGWKLETEIQQYTNAIGLEVELLKHMPNNEYNEKMASVRLFLEEYPCPAYSRATVVSAAVGTPQVGNDMNEPATGCFPDLTPKYGDWNTWNQLAGRLISDDEFWLEQSEAGRENAWYYYYPAVKERLLALYNKLKDR